MIKTRLGAMIGGAFWTPGVTILGPSSQNLTQLIKSLFSLGEQGFAYDPNDLSTLYQDAAGTIPVTATGQPVGLMKDKSGRNNHAYQTVSASRPILQRNATTGAYYLAFDGVDDFLVTNNIDFTMTDKVSLFAGVRKLSDASTGLVCELGPNVDVTNGTFSIMAPAFAGAEKFRIVARGSVLRSASTASLDYSAPKSAVVTSNISLQTPLIELRINGVSVQKSTLDLGGGNLSNNSLCIGRRLAGILPFNGHIYSLIGLGRLTTDSETIALEKSIAKNVGVTL